MKRTSIKSCTLIFMIFLFGFIIGCKKKDKEPSKTDKLTGYSWVATSAKLSPSISIPSNPTPIESIYDQMEPCFKDDKIKFANNGTYLLDIGENKCSSEVNYSATWAFGNNETSLTINNFGNTGNPLTFSINELSTNIMTLQLTITSSTQQNTILRTYGFPTSKSNDPVFQSGTTFTLVMRTI